MNFTKIKGDITSAEGFKAGAVKTGIKNNSLDLAIIYCENLAETAAVYTTNQVQAAPIKICREHLADGSARAIVINSGIANACTGEEGLQNALQMTETAAGSLHLKKEDVLVASTGIIGKQLPMSKIKAGIEEASENLAKDSGKDAAKAIQTTDTTVKRAAAAIELDGHEVKIGGMAKGSGMIEPNMATMLSFITTDASIKSGLLQEVLKECVDVSFNKITVDGDQSTNDMIAVMASGKSGAPEITAGSAALEKFKSALKYVTEELAKMIVKDGEGATKFIEINVSGASDSEQAQKIARQIAGSPLVKTAVYGESPSWGRIAAAAGSAVDDFDSQDLEIELNGKKVFGPEHEVHEFPGDILSSSTIRIDVDPGCGEASDTVWTCDFSDEYVEINAKYYS